MLFLIHLIARLLARLLASSGGDGERTSRSSCSATS